MLERIGWCWVDPGCKLRTSKERLEGNRCWSYTRTSLLLLRLESGGKTVWMPIPTVVGICCFAFQSPFLFILKAWLLWGNDISPLTAVLVGQSIKLYHSPLTQSWACAPSWRSHILFPRTLSWTEWRKGGKQLELILPWTAPWLMSSPKYSLCFMWASPWSYVYSPFAFSL